MFKMKIATIILLLQLHQVFNLTRMTSKLIEKIKSTSNRRQQRGPGIPYSFPTHQLLVTPGNLHVIPIQPIQNVYNQHSAAQNHTTQLTQATQLIPVYSYIPLHHNYLVPVQDLSVIPLNHHHQNQLSHFRMMESRRDEEERKFRDFYGGYGQGLQFGGHGAGHGFYVTYGYG